MHCTFYAIIDIAEYSLSVRLVSQAIAEIQGNVIEILLFFQNIFLVLSLSDEGPGVAREKKVLTFFFDFFSLCHPPATHDCPQ